MIKYELDYESASRQKIIAKDFSGDDKTSELDVNLYQLVNDVQNNTSDLSYEDLYNLLIKIEEIVYHISEISDYFIKDLNIVSMFSQILQTTDNREIFEISLIILQGLIYLSPDALDIFIQLDLTDLLLTTLNENSANFGNDDYIISTILGILQIMIESQNSHSELKILPQLFNFVGICQNRINENTEVAANLKICLGIFGSFIRFNDKELITQFISQFLEIKIFLPFSEYQEETIPIVCDLAGKGFINEVIESGLYQICFDLLNDESFKKSYEFIVKLICQFFDFQTNSESFELTQDYLDRIVPFNRIYQLLKFYKDEEIQEACLVLYEKVASIGGLKILLDQEVEEQNKELLIKYLDNGYYLIRSKVYRLLWDGLLKLNNSVDQVSIMNSPIFISMTSYVDFLDDSEFIYGIFSFFEYIFSIIASSTDIKLDQETTNCINSFASECINCDNEELMQLVNEFLDKF